MRPPQETGSKIEVDAFKKRIHGLPGKLAERQTVIRQKDPDLSSAFRNLLPIVPFEDSMRATPQGDVWITFLREDIKVPGGERKPNTLYLLEQVVPYPDVDAAARGLGYVSSSYEAKSGDIPINTRTVIEEAQQISYELQASGITDEDLARMSQRAMDTFVAAKFASSQSADKVRVIAQTLKALSRDAKTRINTPRSRMIMANVREPLTRMLFKAREIRNKNVRRRVGLMQEREMERSYMSFVQERIEEMIELSAGDGSFDRGLRRFLEFAHSRLSPHAILVKPYVQAAAEARFLLFANDRISKGADRKTAEQRLAFYIGDEQAVEVAREIAFPELDSNGKKARLLYISSMLQDAMDRSKKRLNTSKEDMLFEEGTLFNPGTDSTV
jgi:hypothetical protein